MVKNILKPIVNALPSFSRHGDAKKCRFGSCCDATVSSDTMSSSSNTMVNFGEELRQMSQDKRCTHVVLKDFVNLSDRQDFLSLKQAMKTQDEKRRNKKHKWQDIQFVDTLHGSQFRRWQYKKAGLCRLIKQCPNVKVYHGGEPSFSTGGVSPVKIRFESRLELSDMKPLLILSILQEVHKDLDILSLEISGKLSSRSIPKILQAVSSLVQLNDRQWQGITINITPVNSDEEDEQEFENDEERELGQRILLKACQDLENVAVLYNIPVAYDKMEDEETPTTTPTTTTTANNDNE